MSQYEFTASLRMRHPRIDPATITQTLGIKPQHTWQSGTPRIGPVGESLEGLYHESYWMARLMETPQLSGQVSVEEVLRETLANLRRSQPFLEQIQAEGGVTELHVSLFARANFNVELPASTLALLGRLGVGVALDIHTQSAQTAEPERQVI
jgi:Domain of unknown function (DUF4279)